MNPDLQNLYKQTLLKHSKNPLNNYEIEHSHSATKRNPLCGDEITVYQDRDEQSRITFTAQACSICLASASMMTEKLSELDPADHKSFAEDFVSKFKDKSEQLDLGGELESLSGVQAFPSRIRCATLPWETFLEIKKEE